MLRSLINYFTSSKEELEKVSWPSQQDTLRYGALIVAGSVAAAVFFGALDFGLGKVVQVVIAARHPQTAPLANEPVAPTVEVQPNIEAVDASGKKVNVDVKTIPLESPPAPSN